MRQQEPPEWFIGPAFILIGGAGFFSEPSAGVPPVLAYGFTGLFVVIGISVTMWSLGVKSAQIWFGRIIGIGFAIAMTWLAFLAPEEVQCTTTRYFVGINSTSTRAGCDTTPFMFIAVVLDLFVIHGIISELRKLQLSSKP